MENETEVVASQTDETTAVAETADVDTTDAAALQQKVIDLAEKNKQLFARAKKAEGFELKNGHWVRSEKPVVAPKASEVAPQATTEQSNDLDETSQLFLTVKGIEKPEEVELVQKWRKETGRNVRAIESNPIFQAELKALRNELTVQGATPTGQNRSTGTPSNSEDYWYAKYMANDKLPDGMPPGMAAKLVHRREGEESSRSPRF